MLRSSIQSQFRAVSAPRCRTFVSTVLLTRNWENETVAALRTEAKERGLSQKGNKATLITRLQKHDKQRMPMRDPVPSAKVQSSPPTSKSVLQHVRQAHTTEVPGVPSSSEPPHLSPNFPKEFLDIKIPVTSTPIVAAPTPIPFVPDFWASGHVKAESTPSEDHSSPNLIAVAGDATHISVSPAHNLYIPEAEEALETRDTSKTTFFEDVAHDLSLPAFKLPVDVEKLQKADLSQVTGTSRGQEVDHSRKLDKDEVSGVWILLGMFFGSWVAAGLFKSSSAFAKEGENHPEAAVAAETSTKH